MWEPDLGGGAQGEAYAGSRKRKPTGDIKSLLGTIDPKSFGNRASRNLAPTRKRLHLDTDEEEEEEEEGVYQPMTEETRRAYEDMLNVIQQQLGGQPLNIVTAAADEILGVLKNEEPEKKREIERLLLSSISINVFDSLVQIGNLITDYQGAGDMVVENNDAVVEVLDDKEDEEDEEEYNDVVVEEEEDVAVVAVKSKRYKRIWVPLIPFTANVKLVKISEMPEWTRRAFYGMTELNSVESAVYHTALFEMENILLCAPTGAGAGAGQTNVAVLTILHQFALNTNRFDCSINHNGYKIVYIAPVRALVAQVVENLSKRFKSYGVNVREMSGDDQTLTHEQIEKTQIIVTTPEDWDMITRKLGYHTCTQFVTLVIIDGVHLLRCNRGPILESIVARTVRQMETSNKHIRLVGLSATFPLPNCRDVAQFLRVDEGLFHFDNSYRPVPLYQKFIGINVRKPMQRFRLMNDLCYENVMVAVAGNQQVLIFVHSGNQTGKTACTIRDTALAKHTLGRFLKQGSETILRTSTGLVDSNYLKDLLPYGFAIHHDGLSRAERQAVEELFTDGHVQVLVSTATLAWGVNLPAHTVIIKGTQVYDPEKEGAWTELSPLDVMQMLGLAGRPRYDSYGVGIIITEHHKQQYYLSLLNQQLPIQSQFESNLVDQLNAEILLGTVQNHSEACSWLQYTYLSVHMRRVPTLYGLEADHLQIENQLKRKLADLINTAANILDDKNLIKYDNRSGHFQVTDLGQITSYYYITHGTISAYHEHLKSTTNDIELCRLFSRSEEFKYVTVQQDEKMELANLMNLVVIPVEESLEEPSAKINVLLQAYISRLELQGLSLTCDMIYITQCAERLLRALFQIALKCGWAKLAERALNLCKMVNKRLWSAQTPLRQFHGIPNDILMKLEKDNCAWKTYCELSSQELGELIGMPGMGITLHKFIHQFPKLNLAAHVQPITRTVLRVELTITPDFQWEDKFHGCVEPFWVIVENSDQQSILHHEHFLLKKQYIDKDHTVNFTVQITEPLPPQYFIRVVSDRWLGSQTIEFVSFVNLILPEKYPPSTELLDLQQISVTAALKNPLYEALYDLTYFNRVQTQVFSDLYYFDDNVLVAAPTGCGKTICAEFAILRNHRMASDSGMRVVYIAPIENLAKERHTDWQRRFGRSDGLNLCVVELTGETVTDLKLLEKGHIIISTPEKWDALSRSWKERKHVQEVSLFIIDEVQLIGGQGGPVFENIISRIRYISSEGEKKIRIVALSTSLANANDLGEWIGATSNGLFNFPPAARPVPLEIHIQGVDLANFETMMHALAKSTYTAIVQHGKPALVYVPTGKHAQLTALDLVTYSDADSGGRPSFSLRFSKEIIQSIEKISDKTLGSTLRHGVGYLHEGLSIYDQNTVSNLFKAEHIQVCVMSGSMSWEVPLSALLVVVMGTQYYDDRENFHFDYPITDLLQMIDHAGRPTLDNSGRCVIFCRASRKAYYMKFLHEALPVESHLHHYLHDYLNAEVVAGIIKNRQDAVDYLKQTFLYRRLTQNPSYYNLQGVAQGDLSVYLSKLLTDTLSDLEKRKFISIENDKDLSPLNLGRIASNYYISYTSVEHFSFSLTSKTKMKGLLEILTHASEYTQLSLRPGEEEVIRRLINHQRFSFENPNCRDPHFKANALLQASFARHQVAGILSLDQRLVLLSASRLLPAMVDVISSNGWLKLALLAMKVSQMVSQGMWEYDSMLLQLPHFTKDLAERCQHNQGKSIETVSDLVGMKNEERCALLESILEMSATELADIEQYCRRFPNNEMTFEVCVSENARAEEIITLQVDINHGQVGAVDTPRYPKKTKEEWWWLVIGDTKTDSLLDVKRVPSQKNEKVKLGFAAPEEAGTKTYTLYMICDSYLGCDKEHSFNVDVKGADRSVEPLGENEKF